MFYFFLDRLKNIIYSEGLMTQLLQTFHVVFPINVPGFWTLTPNVMYICTHTQRICQYYKFLNFCHMLIKFSMCFLQVIVKVNFKKGNNSKWGGSKATLLKIFKFSISLSLQLLDILKLIKSFILFLPKDSKSTHICGDALKTLFSLINV